MASTKSPKKKLKSVMPYIILIGIVLLIFGIGFLIGRLCIPTQAKDDTTQIINSTVLTTEETIVETEPPIEWLEFRATAYCPCEKCCGKWATLRPKDENGSKDQQVLTPRSLGSTMSTDTAKTAGTTTILNKVECGLPKVCPHDPLCMKPQKS